MAAIHWYWIVGWFFTLFGLVGNTWVIFIILKRRRLQTTANWFIFSLAVADLGVTCGYFPASMICNVLVESCNNGVRLYFSKFFLQIPVFALIATVAERYVAIVHSLKYLRVFTTNTRTVIIIATSWGIPAILAVLRLIYDIHINKLSAQEDRTVIIIYEILFVVRPATILFAATTHILLTARKLSLQMKALLTQVRFNVAPNSVKLMKAARMGVKTSTVKWVTVLVFIFEAYCGTEIYITICQTFELCVVSIDVKTAFNLLLLANSALNPLVYAFLKEDIKRETKILFCRRRHFIKPPRRLFQVHRE